MARILPWAPRLTVPGPCSSIARFRALRAHGERTAEYPERDRGSGRRRPLGEARRSGRAGSPGAPRPAGPSVHRRVVADERRGGAHRRRLLVPRDRGFPPQSRASAAHQGVGGAAPPPAPPAVSLGTALGPGGGMEHRAYIRTCGPDSERHDPSVRNAAGPDPVGSSRVVPVSLSARALFGARGALLALALYVLDPNVV